MEIQKILVILFSILNFTAVGVFGACEFAGDTDPNFKPIKFDDSKPAGTVIGYLRFKDTTLPETTTVKISEIHAKYFQALIQRDPFGSPILTIQTTEEFSDFLDIEQPEKPETFQPEITVHCKPEDNLKLPAYWVMDLKDTNNKGPEFEKVQKYIDVDLDTWKDGDIINTEFTVIDKDYSRENAVITVSAIWVKDPKTKIVTASNTQLQPNKPKGKFFTSNVELKLVKDTKPGNYTIRLDATDNTGAHKAEEVIYVNVNNGIQQTGTFIMVTLVSFIAAWTR